MYRDECYEKRRIVESAGLPEDTTLPFLTYGFYKPNQLAFSTIEKYVYHIEHASLNNWLEHVNGMPVLTNESFDDFKVDAYILEFKYAQQEKAYKTIGYSKNRHIYRWEVMKVNGRKVNILMNNSHRSYPTYTPSWQNYDWRRDPVFLYTLKYLDKHIARLKNESENKFDMRDFEAFIEIQSLYMVLWAALDRFLTFRYGKSKTRNVKELSQESFFKESLSKNYNALSKQEFFKSSYENENWKNLVFSAEDLTPYELNPQKPTCSAMYYYTLRNNVVHAGKMMPEERNIILNALLGLTEIYRDILRSIAKK